MGIIRYEPWQVLNQMARNLDQYLQNQPGQGPDEESAIATSAWVPAVDISEDENNFIIEADIPGVDPQDIEVSMEKGVLSIRGERAEVSQEELGKYKRMERTRGSFYRRFSLPDTADADNITASGKNGVLTINIPKREVAQTRKITVNT